MLSWRILPLDCSGLITSTSDISETVLSAVLAHSRYKQPRILSGYSFSGQPSLIIICLNSDKGSRGGFLRDVGGLGI